MAQIQRETRNFQFYSAGMVLQGVLHKERKALRVLAPKVNMTTKWEHELVYCVALQCFAKVALEESIKKKRRREIKPQAERSKHSVNMKEKCSPLGVLSFFSDLVSGIVSFLPSQRFSCTQAWSRQIAQRQDTHPLLRIKIIFLAKQDF